jgi:hypothetical protein
MPFTKSDSVISEVVVWNGRRYRRYPEAKSAVGRRYFSRSNGFLHRDVWRAIHGEIPVGYEIHHIDGNTTNNDISNLECIPRSLHKERHRAELIKRGKSNEQLSHLRKIRPLTKEWHKSDEGRAWHRENAKSSLATARLAVRFSKKPDLHRDCEECGSNFVTRNVRKIICSVACHSKKKRRLKSAGQEPLYPV